MKQINRREFCVRKNEKELSTLQKAAAMVLFAAAAISAVANPDFQ